jgi:hypothetical protein
MIFPPANRWQGRQVSALERLAAAHDELARATQRQARLNRRYLAPHWRANAYTRGA